LSPHRSKIDHLADEITEGLIAKGQTLEGMLKTLRKQREKRARQPSS